MRIIPELKHNKFRSVSIPKPIALYKQYGLASKLDSSGYSGDEYLDPSKSKVEAAQEVSQEFFEPTNAE